MQSVRSLSPKHVAIQKAYIVSCVNSRASDIAEAASVLRGKKVHEVCTCTQHRDHCKGSFGGYVLFDR